MQPTGDIGDRVVVNKMAYGLRAPMSQTYFVRYSAPAPGDVVVLDSPVDDRVLLKRVAAVPGDEVSVRDGRITRNGVQTPVEDSVEALGRPHTISLGGPDFGPSRLGPDQYLLMGDNRGNSYDGRSFGMVSASTILGRAESIYWHDSRFVWRPLH